MTEHTKEPWVNHQEDNIITDTKGTRCLAQARGSHISIDERNANARRIVACINACAGIPTGMLEAGDAEILAYSISLMKQRDELINRASSVLEGLEDGLDSFGDDGAMPTRIEKLRAILEEIEATK
jgi:hypothetical protein